MGLTLCLRILRGGFFAPNHKKNMKLNSAIGLQRLELRPPVTVLTDSERRPRKRRASATTNINLCIRRQRRQTPSVT